MMLFSALKSIAAAKWQTVDGEIEFVELEDDCNELCREPVLLYHYKVGANQYTSSRYAFGFMARLTRFESVGEVDNIVWREPLLVYYHPKKPQLSVLLTGIRIHHIVHGLFFTALILISMVIS